MKEKGFITLTPGDKAFSIMIFSIATLYNYSSRTAIDDVLGIFLSGDFPSGDFY